LKEYKNTESKFRFVILASQRAKQLLKGAKPKIKSGSRNLVRVAQEEIHRGLIDYRVLQPEREIQEKKEKEAAAEELESLPEETESEESSEGQEEDSEEK
jgi:DNA-directed RNA polymerase omega subunit